MRFDHLFMSFGLGDFSAHQNNTGRIFRDEARLTSTYSRFVGLAAPLHSAPEPVNYRRGRQAFCWWCHGWLAKGARAPARRAPCPALLPQPMLRPCLARAPIARDTTQQQHPLGAYISCALGFNVHHHQVRSRIIMPMLQLNMTRARARRRVAACAWARASCVLVHQYRHAHLICQPGAGGYRHGDFLQAELRAGSRSGVATAKKFA